MPPVLWTPSPDRVATAAVTRFADTHGLPTDYAALWRWSVAHLDEFWAAVWRHFDLRGGYDHVRDDTPMPGTRWFPGARVNFAEQVFRDKPDDALALQYASELRPLDRWTWGDLRRETARVRAGLVARGVGPGDRVAAYLPNVPETIAAFLATASLGAIWSSAAPEFGARAVVDRFAQIEPKVLLAVDGYRYNARDVDRAQIVRQIHQEVGGELVRFGHLDGTGWQDDFAADGPLTFERVPFEHPLWVLYSSGTTGLPKAIVHGHGGILLEHLKHMHFHLDARPGDRIFWFTTTGWMMWNFLVGVLLTDASIVLYDGSPGGDTLWDLAEEAEITTFGTSAAYISACMKRATPPRAGRRLQINAIGSTGSPLTAVGFQWVYDELGADTWLFSMSGGTDVCTAFLAGVPVLPVHAGELQARALGCDVQAWDEHGQPVTDAVGELVVAQPMPSMPTGFWGDADGARYRATYFDTYPGVWRHGDWVEITSRGTAIIHGRSDATINRGGVRMGTSEIYGAVLAIDEIADALVVDVPRPGHENWMPLFVVLDASAVLDDDLLARVRERIRDDCSPRHVPDDVHAVAEIPRTLSGKVLEVPVKRILMGTPPDEAASRDSLANPAALDAFAALAQSMHGGEIA